MGWAQGPWVSRHSWGLRSMGRNRKRQTIVPRLSCFLFPSIARPKVRLKHGLQVADGVLQGGEGLSGLWEMQEVLV